MHHTQWFYISTSGISDRSVWGRAQRSWGLHSDVAKIKEYRRCSPHLLFCACASAGPAGVRRFWEHSQQCYSKRAIIDDTHGQDSVELTRLRCRQAEGSDTVWRRAWLAEIDEGKGSAYVVFLIKLGIPGSAFQSELSSGYEV